jgi:AcrR family transcriptional regulator
MAAARKSRESWIEAGMQALADGGPEAVRVELLARSLGLTKGSFYWHFKDRQALLDELLEVWERRMLDEVVEEVEREGGDGRARLEQLFSLARSGQARGMARVELAIRDWARHDAEVEARLRRVDNRRMEYMRSLFGEICTDEDEVETRCLLAFSLFVASGLIAADHGAHSRAEVLEMALTRLLA